METHSQVVRREFQANQTLFLQSFIVGCETPLWARLSVGRSVGWLVWHNFLKCQDVSIPCSYRSTCWFLDWQLWILPKIPIKVVTSVVSLKISNFLLMGGLYQLRIPWNTIFCYATVQIKFVFIHTIWILKMPLIKFYMNVILMQPFNTKI